MQIILYQFGANMVVISTPAEQEFSAPALFWDRSVVEGWPAGRWRQPIPKGASSGPLRIAHRRGPRQPSRMKLLISARARPNRSRSPPGIDVLFENFSVRGERTGLFRSAG